jgi:Tfp pilus assembly protein PilP
MSPELVLSRNNDIIANAIGTETVMMSIEAGRYFGTNNTGSYIWKILENPLTFKELCDILAADFKITKEQCIDEVTPFIEELSKENIILVH